MPGRTVTLYQDGLDNSLSVPISQVQALAAQTTEVQVQIQQIQAAVSLMRALGRG
jgi:outer membrane protein TolC